jgi:hypothetical protein
MYLNVINLPFGDDASDPQLGIVKILGVYHVKNQQTRIASLSVTNCPIGNVWNHL